MLFVTATEIKTEQIIYFIATDNNNFLLKGLLSQV